jgi:5'-phosphate synthase pdxT subunit
MVKPMKIGVLALQGDVALHMAALKKLGADPVPVREPKVLGGLGGLVVPGGESTALLKLCKPIGMLPAIEAFAGAGKPVLGTCAGAILLADKVTDPEQPSLGLIDITIRRNGFGRQIDSMETYGQACPPLGTSRVPLTFIRAPRITAVGPKAEVLATYQNEPVLVRQKNVMAATFHPEMAPDMTIYKYWVGAKQAVK